MSKPKPAKLGEIDKHENKLEVWIQEYNGHTYLDARERYLCRKTKEWKPTKKGITLTSADEAEKKSVHRVTTNHGLHLPWIVKR